MSLIASVLAAAAGAAIVSADPGCRIVTISVQSNEILDEGNTAPAVCSAAVGAKKVRYDPKERVSRARIDLAAGEPLGRIYLASRPAVLAGDRIQIRANIGRVSVMREVEALQPAMSGQSFFVRDESGAIFVAPPVRKESVR